MKLIIQIPCYNEERTLPQVILRTFLYCAVLPAYLGLALCLRFMYYYLFRDSSGHIQSLILAAILLILSFLMTVLGILADLISTNRQLIQEAIFIQRKRT